MAAADTSPAAAAIRAWWSQAGPGTGRHERTADPAVAAELLGELVTSGQFGLPLPAAGHTRERYDALAEVGAADLTLARLAEAHVDATAILAELAADEIHVEPGELWGVWAAEPPHARVAAARGGDRWTLHGRKAWCSGAGCYTHALITAHAEDGPRLFAVALGQPAVTVADDGWPDTALMGSDTRSVVLDRAAATPVGGPDDYVARPGFWHGAVGVAAVWYGGAVAVGDRMRAAAADREPDQIGLMHLGAVDAALGAARASLHVAADAIDADPLDRKHEAALIARRTRAIVETAVTTVIDRCGRSLGPSPLATESVHARRVADLALYLRQSHADRDLAELGKLVRESRW